MKKLLATTAILAAFAAAPVLAQELESYTQQQVDDAVAAIEAAGVSDTAYQNLWCGAAFVILNQLATNQGMADVATQATQASDAVYNKAATELRAAGVNEADFGALAKNFRIVAISQTEEGAQSDYTQDECIAAAQAP